jgi:serine/threonine protein kinase
MSNSNDSNDPTGLYIDSNWRIGSCLGRGACGSVHSLEKASRKKSATSSSSTKTSFATCNYVIKIAPFKKSKGSRKKKKNDMEKNADLLYFENTLYGNVLNHLRGTMIPDIPVPGYNTDAIVPPFSFGEINADEDGDGGFRYIIMERMKDPFHHLVPLLFQSASKASIDIGIIASRMIDLIEAIHSTQRLFVDIKPANFMLASSAATTGTSKKKSSTSKNSKTQNLQSAANRIRLIDFGLVESFHDISNNNKHRVDNFPNGQMVGTPIYASLNVLSGHTVSRRDDMEALGYVIVELILQLLDYNKKHIIKSSKSRSASSTSSRRKQTTAAAVLDIDDVDLDLLPWSNCGAKSDDEIFKLKKNAMQSEDGILWQMLKTDYTNEDDDKNYIGEIFKQYFEYVMKLQFKEKPDYDLLRGLVSDLRIEVCQLQNSTSEARKSSGTFDDKKALLTKRATRHSSDTEGVAFVPSPPTHKRKTRSSARASEGSEKITSESVTMVTQCNLRSSGKARKKRITKTIVTTTETVEIIESSDDEELSNDASLDEFLDTHEHVSIAICDSDDDMESVQSSEEVDESINQSFKSCDSMDWEVVENDENEAATSNQTVLSSGNGNDIKDASKIAKEMSLVLECIEGRHKGQYIKLAGELLVGTNPKRSSKSKKKQDVFVIEDEDASEFHAKLVLNKTGNKKKTLLTVRVNDMKSENGTYVNGKKVVGSGKQAFLNDKVKIGECVFRIKQAS